MYDIIGDIHGHATKLKALLTKLGYTEHNKLWSHPTRKLISLGDLIDRGPEQVEVVDILKTMQEAGEAIVIMGNHEFNAVAWYLQNEDGEYLRSHTPKNTKQHEDFLVQADPNSGWYHDTIAWFKSLPLLLEHDDFCCIHAAWDEHHIPYLKNVLSDKQSIKEQDWVNANTQGHALYDAIEYCLKGPELNLPNGAWFLDPGNNKRDKIRLKWWDLNQESTYQSAAISLPDASVLPPHKIPSDAVTQLPVGKSIFFGHYWMRGTPALLSNNIACLDWTVVFDDGHLAAYRFNGEKRLNADNLVWV